MVHKYIFQTNDEIYEKQTMKRKEIYTFACLWRWYRGIHVFNAKLNIDKQFHEKTAVSWALEEE